MFVTHYLKDHAATLCYLLTICGSSWYSN